MVSFTVLCRKAKPHEAWHLPCSDGVLHMFELESGQRHMRTPAKISSWSLLAHLKGRCDKGRRSPSTRRMFLALKSTRSGDACGLSHALGTRCSPDNRTHTIASLECIQNPQIGAERAQHCTLWTRCLGCPGSTLGGQANSQAMLQTGRRARLMLGVCATERRSTVCELGEPDAHRDDSPARKGQRVAPRHCTFREHIG